jgi:uncharacterized membrane-anchored protein
MRAVLCAGLTAVSFIFFSAPLVAYISESDSARTATCDEASASAGTFGDTTLLLGLVSLGAAIATIVFARRARADGERSVVVWTCVGVATVAICVGILIFAAAVLANYNACPFFEPL